MSLQRKLERSKKKLLTTTAPYPNIIHGNKEVVELFEQWLNEARKGALDHACVVASKERDWIGMSYAGNPGKLPMSIFGCESMKAELEARHNARKPGPRNELLDASYHEYNLATDPINHDFLIYLIDAEMYRIRHGAPKPLRIGFSHADELTEKGRRFWEAVHKPLMTLIGAVEDVDAIGGRRAALFTPSEICLNCKKGEKVPLLKARQPELEMIQARYQGRMPYVTITLREYKEWPHRNSHLESWVRFARDLQAQGERVIFVRDTDRANEPLEDFETYPQASFYTNIRMALYEKSRCNFFVSNGPAGLGLFGDRPYLYFLRVYRDDEYEANNPEWWPKANGIGEGEQWPWALPTQRMIWKSDKYHNLCEAWEEMRGKLA